MGQQLGYRPARTQSRTRVADPGFFATPWPRLREGINFGRELMKRAELSAVERGCTDADGPG
jgi:hypothetical protein